MPIERQKKVRRMLLEEHGFTVPNPDKPNVLQYPAPGAPATDEFTDTSEVLGDEPAEAGGD